jgi:hypothetical protein
MTTPIAVSLATSTAARMAAVDTLALLAAIVVAVSVVGVLVASVLFDPSAPRPYRLATAHPRRVPPLSANQDIPHAA